MPRRSARALALERAAFLRELARTGNARAAACALGLNRATLTRRRASDPAFAARWDAALALAHAALQEPPRNGEGDRRPKAGGGGVTPHRTTPAPEPHLVQTPSGRLQLRAPGRSRRITTADEQAFLAALSATANIRLSARAAGFAHSSFYARARRNPAFAREMRLALEMGYERLELALLESFDPASYEHDAWRHNDPPPIPPMTANQALQLLHLHHKTTQLWADRPDRRRKRGESTDLWSLRLAAKWRAEREREEEDRRLARAAEQAGADAAPSSHEPPPPSLPALDQVTGWSKARVGEAERPDGKRPREPGLALFGGWRIWDWEGG